MSASSIEAPALVYRADTMGQLSKVALYEEGALALWLPAIRPPPHATAVPVALLGWVMGSILSVPADSPHLKDIQAAHPK